MPHFNYYMLVGIGGLVFIIGLATMLRGRRGEKRYYDSLSTQVDVREFLEHSPTYPRYELLKMRGWIAIAVGLALSAVGGIFSLLD